MQALLNVSKVGEGGGGGGRYVRLGRALHKLAWGLRGSPCGGQGVEPLEAQEFYTLNYHRWAYFYTLFVTLTGHKLAWGPGAEPPEAQRFWAINYDQISIFSYLICDIDGTQIRLAPGGRAPEAQGLWAIITVRWAYLYTLFVTLAG